MYMGILSTYTSGVPCAYLALIEARRGHQMLWNWKYRWFWVARIKPRSSGRRLGGLNIWTISAALVENILDKLSLIIYKVVEVRVDLSLQLWSYFLLTVFVLSNNGEADHDFQLQANVPHDIALWTDHSTSLYFTSSRQLLLALALHFLFLWWWFIPSVDLHCHPLLGIQEQLLFRLHFLSHL